MTIKTILKKLFIPQPPAAPEVVPSGLYHYMREAGSASSEPGTYTRFHLRVEPDGRGMLLANATAAARLSPSGVLMAKELLDGASPEKVLADLKASFRGAPLEVMQYDLERVAGLINGLAAPGDNYPILNFEDPDLSPYEARLMAPLQADVPLVEPEQLALILDRLWAAGIPHVTFLAPENANPTHLVRAVERAEDLGMIAGVRGRATDLSQGNLLRELALAGVDHVTVPYASAGPAVHDAFLGLGDHAAAETLLVAIQENEVAAVAEVPLVEETLAGLRQTLNALLALGIHNYSFFAIAALNDMSEAQRAGALTASAMPQAASRVEELSNDMDVRFIWQPPVQRDPAISLAVQVQRGPRASGDVSMRVEPDGAVIPPRGPYRSAGNLLADEWPNIWNDDAFLHYRERVERPTRCDECPDLAICAVDCPRKPAGWSQGVGGVL
ncbi:MAG: hypothetical protein L0332_28045 [Chloroflexi bacterium]|nr:hypothetical protein [Chloroflexota bacterium]MCI0574783.1 hypothetical protein [Chloroflexota bacterium]MCI0648858.1 hypothetical protein [Chloroflexota bacterium]MCI0730552.1 hypothetical protein [Chloroflexota bacterium]